MFPTARLVTPGPIPQRSGVKVRGTQSSATRLQLTYLRDGTFFFRQPCSILRTPYSLTHLWLEQPIRGINLRRRLANLRGCIGRLLLLLRRSLRQWHLVHLDIRISEFGHFLGRNGIIRWRGGHGCWGSSFSEAFCLDEFKNDIQCLLGTGLFMYSDLALLVDHDHAPGGGFTRARLL